MKKKINIYIPFKGTMISIGVGIGILIVFGLVGNMEYKDAKYDEQLYCKLRSAWEREKAMGIPAEQRNGVPNYRFNKIICNDS